MFLYKVKILDHLTKNKLQHPQFECQNNESYDRETYYNSKSDILYICLQVSNI